MRGSGDVFADLSFSDAPLMRLKSRGSPTRSRAPLTGAALRCARWRKNQSHG